MLVIFVINIFFLGFAAWEDSDGADQVDNDDNEQDDQEQDDQEQDDQEQDDQEATESSSDSDPERGYEDASDSDASDEDPGETKLERYRRKEAARVWAWLRTADVPRVTDPYQYSSWDKDSAKKARAAYYIR